MVFILPFVKITIRNGLPGLMKCTELIICQWSKCLKSNYVVLKAKWSRIESLLSCKHFSGDSSLGGFCLVFQCHIVICHHLTMLQNTRPITPRKVLFSYRMSTPTKKMHVRANHERRFTDLKWIYRYFFVIPIKYIPGFLKAGLAKIKTHSTTWRLKQ